MENLVAGKVFIEGSLTGVADLVVVVYDLDPAIREQSGGAGLSNDDPIDALLSAPALRTWLDFPGDRLGSVLTDRAGRFELHYADSEFRIRNAEKRPDLLLFVLGPERQMGTPVAARILHYTWIPSVNAGLLEHFMIAIDRELLLRKGVVLPRTPADPASLLARERELIERKAVVSDNLAGLYREQLALRATRHEQARTFWQNKAHSFLPTPMSGVGLFVPRGESVVIAQRAAASAGVTKMRDALVGAGIRLRFNPTELRKAGVDRDRLDADGAVDVSVCDMLAARGLGAELVRVRGLMDELRRQAVSRALLPSEPVAEPEPPTPPDGTGDSPQAFVTRRVLGQLAELPHLEHAESGSTLDELEKIKDTINRLELSGGPANVTAFHDFHTLQVAFEDVWTAAFDDRLREQVQDLYRTTQALHEDYGAYVPPMEDIADANALREYLATVRGAVADSSILVIPPDVQECFPQMDIKTWNQLDEAGRRNLTTAAINHLRPWDNGDDINERNDMWSTQEYLDQEYARAIRYQLNSPLAQAERLIVEVAGRLSEPYAFKYFAPGTINYGLLITYRQEWIPETYQVGRLVSTIPLAPGEERKLKVTRKVHQSRAEKSIRKSMMETSAERQFTSRTELEVMAKMASSTNFRMSVTGSLNMGMGEISSTSEFAHNQQQEASQQKKQFLESVQKAAEKVRQETEIQVETSEQAEHAMESETVLKNPNNELTVTYLLYELERRYRVSSRPHRLTPVVLVAMDIPAPHEISEAWILEHSWILRRCLLDDAFLDPIAYIEDGQGADSIAIEVKKANWDTLRAALAEFESDYERLVALRTQRQDTLVTLLEQQQLAAAAEMDDGQRAAAAFFSGGLSELFGGGASDRDEIIKARREATEKALEFLQSRIEAASERVSMARKSVTEAAEAYSQAIQEKTQKDTGIRQFQLHLRQNILHYMHHIFAYKHPDQQQLELSDLQVPFLESATRRCRLRLATPAEIDADLPGVVRDGERYIVECAPPEPPATDGPLPTRRLGSIADLNRPIGFHGNYAIYPLRTCSYLTDFMSQDYVDDYFGLRDPSTGLGYTGEELLAYASQLLSDPDTVLSDTERDALLAAVRDDLGNPATGSDTVILPTGQLYMEALKGEQSLLEDFKLAHRGLDVLKAQEDVRTARLENLRRAARLVADEPLYDDPDIEKLVVVNGAAGLRLTPDRDPPA